MSASKLGRAWVLPFGLVGVAVAVNCSDTGGPSSSNTAGSGQTTAGKPSTSGSSSVGGGASGSGGTPSSGGATAGSSNAGSPATAGTGGVSGGSGGSGGEAAGAGGGGGSGGSDPTAAFKPCSTEPAAQVPALKRGPAINGFDGMQTAGQIVGVPGVGNLLYVIGHRNGDVYTVKDGMVQDQPLVHVDVASAGNNEQGLLSMALHPNFANNHLFYLFYTAPNGGAMTIDEFDRTSETAATFKRNIYSRARTGGGQFHNGGSITFNPKDATPFIYFSVGNNSSDEAGDPNAFSGRVLKINAETKDVAQFAYGLRNPYRMSIDRLTGDMYIGDVANGPGGTVIFQEYGKQGVTDFGYRDNNGSPDVNDGLQREGGGAAMIGGFVYRGNKIPGLCGRYIYGLYDGGAVKSIVVKDGQKVGSSVTHDTLTVPGDLTSFGEDGEGELYMASFNNAIYKIVAGP
jgi:hypothetical protein